MYGLTLEKQQDGKKCVIVNGHGSKLYEMMICKTYLGDQRKFDLENDDDFRRLYRFLIAEEGAIKGTRLLQKTYAASEAGGGEDAFRRKALDVLLSECSVIEIKGREFSFLGKDQEYQKIEGALDQINTALAKQGNQLILQKEENQIRHFNIKKPTSDITYRELEELCEVIKEKTNASITISPEVSGMLKNVDYGAAMYLAQCLDENHKPISKEMGLNEKMVARIMDKINNRGFEAIKSWDSYRKNGKELRARIVEFAVTTYRASKEHIGKMFGSMQTKWSQIMNLFAAKKTDQGEETPKSKELGEELALIKKKVEEIKGIAERSMEMIQTMANERLKFEGDSVVKKTIERNEPEIIKQLNNVLERKGYKTDAGILGVPKDLNEVNIIYLKKGDFEINDTFYLIGNYGSSIENGRISINGINKLGEALQYANEKGHRVGVIFDGVEDDVKQMVETVCREYMKQGGKGEFFVKEVDSHEKLHVIRTAMGMNVPDAPAAPIRPWKSITL